MVKKVTFYLLLVLLSGRVCAQHATATLDVLTLPSSVHAAALGGENISIADDEAGMQLHNPALLANVSPRTLSLDYMNYAAGSNLMGVSYVHAFGERHTGAAFARFVSYGSMEETDVNGATLGTFTPKDIEMGVGYSYLLSDYWSGGANFKMVYSHLADFNTFGIAVDLGANYFNPDKNFSFGIAARNVGIQLVHYNDRPERMPFSLQAGITTGLGRAPLRLSVTAVDLTRWSGRQYYTTRESGKVKWTTNIINHFVVGLDYVSPTNLFWIGLGYNFRHGNELHAAGRSALAGFSAGGGLHVKSFSLGLSYERYHKAANGLQCSVSYSF